MKLKAFLQLQKSEIQSLSHTDNLSNIETLSLLGTDTIIAGTVTTGDTTILHSYTSTIAGITMDSGITIGIIIFNLDYSRLAWFFHRLILFNLSFSMI